MSLSLFYLVVVVVGVVEEGRGLNRTEDFL
jgi:hypothetical protein